MVNQTNSKALLINRIGMKKINLFVMLTFMAFSGWTVLSAQTEFKYSSKFLSGFAEEVCGETINYYTLGSQALDALLVRSKDSREFIEWKTQVIPGDIKETTLTFVMIASLQVNTDFHQFDVFLNGKKYFSLKNPVEKSLNTITINGLNNSKMVFTDLEYDRFEDLTGFLYFYLPAKDFTPNKPITVRVQGESAQSRTWFMVFKHSCLSNVLLSSENVILNSNGTQQQSMRIKIFHSRGSEKTTIKIGSTLTNLDLKFGFNFCNAVVEKIDGEKELPIQVKVGNEIIGETKYLFKPIKPISIYLIPHSHHDIGYTHIQDDVRKIQWQHIDDALELAEQTKDYPSGTKFKWNTEVLWALETYLNSADEQKKQKLINAIHSGSIGVDGFYANMLTGLCSPEEWIWLMETVKRINNICNIKIESAMISDIPGWSWSTVPVLAKAGIKYLSCGINQSDRIGSVRKELGDKPFYWISPSGNEKVLTWVHEQGYSAFHYIGKSGTSAGISVLEPTILNYTNKLADDEYPYDMVPLRYTIGSDNGPTDKYLSENIKQWNEKYFSPKIIIATNAEFFNEFENKYGEQIPEFGGDITPYWEDGAGSSANETAINRQSADKLTQTMYLFAQYSPKDCLLDSFYNAWQNVILYDEHTWGSWNSISEPESDFTKQQWKIKQLFALHGQKNADNLLQTALSSLTSNINTKDALEVINTTATTVSDLVTIPDPIKEKIESGFNLIDENGFQVPTQKLSDGSIVFIAKDISAFSSKRFLVGDAKSKLNFNPVVINANSISNEFFSIGLDEENGVINKLLLTGSDNNLINTDSNLGLGKYLYTIGRKPEHPIFAKKNNLIIKENGPLVASLKIKYNAEGCNSFEQEIKVIAGINRIEMNYMIDKKKVYTPEAIRLSFPFDIPDGVINIENAFGIYQPEVQQIKGSCKNFYTLNNYIDVSNEKYGITIISPDAPIFEIGKPTNDANIVGWLDKTVNGTTIYSFLMNNYWHTNFCATQEGLSSYCYILYPHKSFNQVESALQGTIVEKPLTVIPINKNSEPLTPYLQYDNKNISIISIQPIDNNKYIWLVLYNSSKDDSEVNLKFKVSPKAIFNSDLLKNKNNFLDTSIKISGMDLTCILVEK